MKRILTISALFIFAVIFTVNADRRRLLMTRNAAAGGACSTVHAQNASAHSSYVAISSGVNSYFVGEGQYDPGANISVCKVDWILTKDSGDISAKTFNCVIYAMSGNDFTGAVLGTSDNVTGVNAWSDTTVSFTFSSPVAISSGGSYAIAITMNGVDASNFAKCSISASGGLSGFRFGWTSAGTHVSGFGTEDHRLTIYK